MTLMAKKTGGVWVSKIFILVAIILFLSLLSVLNATAGDSQGLTRVEGLGGKSQTDNGQSPIALDSVPALPHAKQTVANPSKGNKDPENTAETSSKAYFNKAIREAEKKGNVQEMLRLGGEMERERRAGLTPEARLKEDELMEQRSETIAKSRTIVEDELKKNGVTEPGLKHCAAEIKKLPFVKSVDVVLLNNVQNLVILPKYGRFFQVIFNVPGQGTIY